MNPHSTTPLRPRHRQGAALRSQVALPWLGLGLLAMAACSGSDPAEKASEPDGSGAATDLGSVTDDAVGLTDQQASDASGGAGVAADGGTQGGLDPDAGAASDAVDALTDPGPVDAGQGDVMTDAAGAADALAAGDGGGAQDGGPADGVGADAAALDGAATDAGAGGGVPLSQAVAGKQYHGGVGFLRTSPPGWPQATQFVEISAPILPSTQVLYKYEGAALPKTQAGLDQVAHEASLIFDFLLTNCKKDFPGITLLPAGAAQPLTQAQLDANFNLTAECSYLKWTAKPYWIPALVDKVNICANELGPDWAMLTEADVHGLTDAEAKLIKEALSPAKPQALGASYFSLSVYIRAANGLLMLSDLYPAAPITAIEKAAQSWYTDEQKWTTHLEGAWVLRCIRIRGVVPG